MKSRGMVNTYSTSKIGYKCVQKLSEILKGIQELESLRCKRTDIIKFDLSGMQCEEMTGFM